ncbi:MAG: glycosyltransferase family 39 protein, partial [bacterium]
MRANLNFRRAVWILAAVCLLTRLGFILGKTQLPVMWDARIYASSALGIIHTISNGGSFGHPENLTPEDSSRSVTEFRDLMNKHISGEQIQWLYYPVPSVRQAQEYIFISGPLYPLWLAALVWVTPAEDFMVARIMNTLLDTLNLILMLFIAYTLFGFRTVVFAGVLYILYIPFVLLTGMLSTDQMTICLLLLSFYLTLRWYESKKSKFVFLLGLTAGLLILTKPTATFLFLLFGMALLYDRSI